MFLSSIQFLLYKLFKSLRSALRNFSIIVTSLAIGLLSCDNNTSKKDLLAESTQNQPSTSVPQTPILYKISGVLTGLPHGSMRLELQASQIGLAATSEIINIENNQSFTFINNYPSGTQFSVRVIEQPVSPTLNCLTLLGEGTLASNNYNSILISCPTITSFQINSNALSIAKNQNLNYVATAIYSDGTQRDVTALTNWNTSQSNVAVINHLGLANTLTSGSTLVQGQFQGFTALRLLNVTDATLQNITISPSAINIEVNGQANLNVIGQFSDGSTKDLTNEALWSSSNTNIFSVTDRLVNGLNAGSGQLAVSFQGLSSSINVTVNNATLTRLEINPVYSNVSIGTSINYQATGLYSNGTRRDLSSIIQFISSNPAAASFQIQNQTGAIFKAHSMGRIQISANYLGQTASATLAITDKEVTHLTIESVNNTLISGFQSQLKAFGHYNDGSRIELTSNVIWNSSDEEILTVSNQIGAQGELLGIKAGQVQVTAQTSNLTAQTNIQVSEAILLNIAITPAQLLISKETHFKVKAHGVFSDGTTLDLTKDVLWTSSSPSQLEMNSYGNQAGYVTNLSNGSGYPAVNISASYLGITSSPSIITITPADLIGIVLNPTYISMPLYHSKNIKAYAKFNDGGLTDISDLVTWSSTDNSTVFVSNAANNSGEITSLIEGSAQIMANFNNFSAQQTIIVDNLSPLLVTESGIGLKSSYFNGRIGVNPILKGQRIDGQINYNWSLGTAPLGVGDSFSIRFEGKIKAPTTGIYQFCTRSDDGVRLWIHGTEELTPLIINNWTDHAVIENCSSNLNLTADQNYEIVLEFFETGGHAVIELFWSGPGIIKSLVPANVLYPSP